MSVVFLFDVDNTLLDNDRVAADLRSHLDAEVGPDCGRLYWELFEQIRTELGYADYLGALQLYRQLRPHDLRVLSVSHFLISYPFANRLFPGSLDALDHCATIGSTAILSDGDVVSSLARSLVLASTTPSTGAFSSTSTRSTSSATWNSGSPPTTTCSSTTR